MSEIEDAVRRRAHDRCEYRLLPQKGPNLSGVDPQTGQITVLFHPRKNAWQEHFAAVVRRDTPRGIDVQGVTAVGRATIRVLGLNEDIRRILRYELWIEGLYEI